MEFVNVHKISQQDCFQKLSDNIIIPVVTIRASHKPSGRVTLSNKKKYTQLVQNLEILDRSKWPKKTAPCFEG